LVSLDGALGQLQPSGDVVLLDGSRLPASAASAASVADASVARKPLQHGSTAPSLPSADGAATVEPCTFDIVLGPLTRDSVLGAEICFCLFEKGFCVLKLCQRPDEQRAAVQAMQDLAEEGRLGRLPEEVEEGYLGLGGRGRVLWLDPNTTTPVHEALLAADQNLSYIASVLAPFSGDVFEKPLRERTPALLSLSLDEEEEEDYPQPPVDDRMLGDFLSAWRRGGVARYICFCCKLSGGIEGY
ncbi:unnamed protein product, partial [Symbiodinium natans]